MKHHYAVTLILALVINITLAGIVQAAGTNDTDSLRETGFRSIREHICPPPGTPAADLSEMFDTEKQRMDCAIISHGHNDHFGGAKYLQDTYGTHIVMSAADWEYIKTRPQLGSPAPLPEPDIAARDGDTITLGNTTVRIVITPGHTPGTISPVFPVHENGREHLVGYWGGAAVSYHPPDELEQYINSANAYATVDNRIDVELSNHPFADGSLLKSRLLSQRMPGDAHPFFSGNDTFREWVSVISDCAATVLTQKQQTAVKY